MELYAADRLVAGPRAPVRLLLCALDSSDVGKLDEEVVLVRLFCLPGVESGSVGGGLQILVIVGRGERCC